MIVEATKPRAYSYIRFSTPEQAMGDSERRQLDAAKAYAEKHGLELDDSLLADRGLSGYHGEHLRKGALGQFLDRVQRGQVPPGSALIIENIDRLSRQGFMDSFDIIRAIIQAEVKIHTLRPEAAYDRAALDSYTIYQLVGQIHLAHDESQKKSERLSAAWAQKRKRAQASGEVFTGRTPAWLRVRDGKFEVIPEAAETIRRIFQWKLSGVGKGTIAKKLNAEESWVPPKGAKRMTTGWRDSYIAKLLTNRAVLGEFQAYTGRGRSRSPIGEPVRGYFPAIVDLAMFEAVQRLRAANRGKGGRIGKASNLFAGLLKCAYCGGPMVHLNKGKPPKGAAYLICDQGRRGVKCRAYSIRYDEAERTIMENCRGLRPEQVLPDPDEHAKECKAAQDHLNGLEAKLADAETRIANLVDQIERTSDVALRQIYEKRILGLREWKVGLEAERVAKKGELAKLEAGRASFENWARGLADLQKALAGGDVDLRLRMRVHLRELIEKIEVFAVGFVKEHDPAKDACDEVDTETLAEEIIDVAAGPEVWTKRFHEFLRFVTDRRMSKHGRFLRVRFKTGATRDLVPKGSIASGRGLEVDEDEGIIWSIVRPDTDVLWREFEKV